MVLVNNGLYSNRPTSSKSMASGPVDRVYHFAEGSTKESHAHHSHRKHHRNRTRTASWESYYSGTSHTVSSSLDTIDGPPNGKQLPPPPGLKNVGNSCYANAALQCLLSTALPHALLDERNAHIIRRHSFNRKLLVHGSGSVDSDHDTNESSKESADAQSAFGSCLSGMSGIYEGTHDEDDDVILARAMGGDRDARDDDMLSDLRASPSRSSKKGRKRQSKKLKDDDATVGSANTLYSDMYHVMKTRQRNADEPDSEADLLCAWLTQELTQITREYTTPPQGFKAEKRRSKYANRGGSSPSNFLGAIFGSPSHGEDRHRNRVVDPGSITRFVNKISPCLRPYQQEDAHEFFRSLLSSLTMHGQNPRLSSLFDGLLESSVTCQTCSKTSLTRDRYMDLSLDIADNSVTTLDGALEKFTMEETLCHDNMVMCSRCKEKRVVTKALRLATAPTMLVINYKRFAYDRYGRSSRLSKQVKFPLKLELEEYMSRANRGKPAPYTLVAVLVHRGMSCDRGHYFAYVRKGKDWYLANDAEVTKVDIEKVLSSQAYVLVYEVAGMKEKHNFDCYSRYHRSLDEADDESTVRGLSRDDKNGGSWDFSSMKNILDVCDIGLCGSIASVVDSSTSRDNESSKEGGSSPKKSKQRKNDDQHSRDIVPALSSDDKLDSTDKVKAYYKRGRSHTPSRGNHRIRDYHHQDNRSRSDSRAAMYDFEPPEGVSQRRAKSLSTRAAKVKNMKMEEQRYRTKRNGSGSSRRVRSRPRDGDDGHVALPPLPEARSGSSTRGVLMY